MNYSAHRSFLKMTLPMALLSVLSLSACDKQPTVVTVPAAPVTVPVPGPAGPEGAPGTPGPEGSKGATGATGDSTTVIVTPPAEPAK